MFIQSAAQESKEFTIRTFSNDKALAKERRNHIVSCSKYAKEQTDAVLRAIRVDNNTGVGNRHRKEPFE
jgi:sarcosine oxidase delta subunit